MAWCCALRPGCSRISAIKPGPFASTFGNPASDRRGALFVSMGLVPIGRQSQPASESDAAPSRRGLPPSDDDPMVARFEPPPRPSQSLGDLPPLALLTL